MKSKRSTANNYSASNIQILEGLEAVRKRPGMYIGGVNSRGLHHLVSEVVDNSIDEALAGYCSEVKVTIHPDEMISVADNGRGIPTGIHPKEKRSALEVVMTVLHAGGKFDKDTYKVSGGLHGVGVSCVNALSSYLKATIYREGKIFEQTYAKGIPNAPVAVVGESDQTGTTILFKPDESIFEVTTYQYPIIANRLRELSFLNPKLRIHLKDLRTTDEEGNHQEDIFYSEKGLAEFIAYLDSNRESILPEPIHVTGMKNQIAVEVAINYNTGHSEQIVSYANNINTAEGGTHLVGLKRGFTRALKKYGEQSGAFEKAKVKPSGDDFREGTTMIVSIKIPEPQFSGQEKTRLTNAEVSVIVDQAVNEATQNYLEIHPKKAKLIMDKVILAAKARQAARQARELIQRKGALSSTSLPGTLADCANKNPASSELFIVEGMSAGGTAKNGRDRHSQAILPLRGKVLNIERTQEHKIYQNEQIRNIITALGVTFEDKEEKRVTNLDKLRYHKIIIMTDADVDGSHIRTLILTLFFRHMPELVERGHIYIALPPLYLIERKGSKKYYCWTEKEREEAIATLQNQGRGEVRVQRYKGLGEMGEKQLWNTTLDPKQRILKQVTIASAIEADRIFSQLMGDKSIHRKELIEKYAKDVDMSIIS